MTIHKSQGATCDAVFVVGPAGLYREAAYVALSRARHGAILYATSRQLLDKDNWLWTSTPYDPPYSDSGAWMQSFTNGSQRYNNQSSKRLCRAVRLIQLSA